MKTLIIMAALTLSVASMAAQKTAKNEVNLKNLLAKANSLELNQKNTKSELGEKQEEKNLAAADVKILNVNDSARTDSITK